jgi:hypothetical protein
MKTTKRLPVTLEQSDEQAIESFRAAERPDGAMLRAWANEHGFRLPADPSESAVVRLLARAGAEALHQRAIEAGYAKLAEQNAEDRASAQARRDRRDRNRERRLP